MAGHPGSCCAAVIYHHHCHFNLSKKYQMSSKSLTMQTGQPGMRHALTAAHLVHISSPVSGFDVACCYRYHNVTWSVCCHAACAVQKWLNWSWVHFGVDLCEPEESCICWGFRSVTWKWALLMGFSISTAGHIKSAPSHVSELYSPDDRELWLRLTATLLLLGYWAFILYMVLSLGPTNPHPKPSFSVQPFSADCGCDQTSRLVDHVAIAASMPCLQCGLITSSQDIACVTFLFYM